MVQYKVFCGERPQRPPSIPDRIWEMLQACWSREPTHRPALERIAVMCGSYETQITLPAWPSPPSTPSDSSGYSLSSLSIETQDIWRIPAFNYSRVVYQLYPSLGEPLYAPILPFHNPSWFGENGRLLDRRGELGENSNRGEGVLVVGRQSGPGSSVRAFGVVRVTMASASNFRI